MSKSFSAQLAPLITAAGGPTLAAGICGVTRQTLNLWVRGATPNLSMQAGALFLLGQASHELPTNNITLPKDQNFGEKCRTPIFGGMLKGPKHSVSSLQKGGKVLR